MMATMDFGRIERAGGRGPFAHQSVFGGGIGSNESVAIAFTPAASHSLGARQPPQAETQHDDGRDDAQPRRGEGRGAEERHGDRVLDRRRARQGGHGEGRGAEGNGRRHQTIRDIGRAKQGLGHRSNYKKGDKQAHAAVSNQGTRQHDRQHGAARTEPFGHEAGDGRDRTAVVHELPEHGAEEE